VGNPALSSILPAVFLQTARQPDSASRNRDERQTDDNDFDRIKIQTKP
jgi:hypothetical protein